nr:MAG TPA: hypothetical protein [Caudoviricetes sp.]
MTYDRILLIKIDSGELRLHLTSRSGMILHCR